MNLASQTSFVLTTTAHDMVAIVETRESARRERGECSLSWDCVFSNVSNGTFVDVTDIAHGTEGKMFVLATDLPPEFSL